MTLKFWGTRGSIPVPGKNTLKYGGNTPCLEIRSGNNLLILDGGSGLRELGNELHENGSPDEIIILFSHYHWDHVQGIPFFKPLYDKNKKIVLYGQTFNNETIKSILNHQMQPAFFPVSIEEFKADISYKEIEPGKKYWINDICIETFEVVHPSPTLTYKISGNNKNIVYMTDNEINLDSIVSGNSDSDFHKHNKELIDFCSGCDYLIHDTMYDEVSVSGKKGWGHSGNISVARFSIIAGIKNLVLFHYNPDYSDKKIDNLLAETREILKDNKKKIKCIAAKEGLEIVF